MDAFSFGMLCAWLLFYNTSNRDDSRFADDFRPSQTAPLPVQAFLKESGMPPQRAEALRRFFELTLAEDPEVRSADFEELHQLLGRERYVAESIPLRKAPNAHAS